MQHYALVVTSIAAPNRALRSLAHGASARGIPFYLMGDVSNPANFELAGCDFFSLERQRNTGLRSAQLCPVRHYARKNMGYLLAMRAGARVVLETDDDNLPRDSFWRDRASTQTLPVVGGGPWVNVYRWFTDEPIWPRGFPLEYVRTERLEALTSTMLTGWSVLFHGATVDQARNDHDLLKDFHDEIPGYLNNARIAEVLAGAPVRGGAGKLGENLLLCYEQFVRLELVGPAELPLLEAWIEDCKECAQA